MPGASVAWGWLGALLGAQGVCAPRWHGLGRAWAEPGGGWAEPGPRSSCSGSERPQCGEAQESLNPILGRKGAMVRHEETEGLIYLFIYFQMRRSEEPALCCFHLPLQDRVLLLFRYFCLVCCSSSIIL